MPARDTPAEIDAVIGPLPRYEAEALPLATGPVIGHRDLHGAVDGLGAGVAERRLLHASGVMRATGWRLEGNGWPLLKDGAKSSSGAGDGRLR